MAAKGKTYQIVEGTSEPQDFTLLDNSTALVGTGLTVGLEVYAQNTLVETNPPTVAWLDQADGTVRVSGVETLPAGEYTIRFSLTDGSGKVGYVPSGSEADTWVVARRYGTA